MCHCFLLMAMNPKLTPLWRRTLLYRHQSIDLQSKSTDWFLYDWNHRHESRLKCETTNAKILLRIRDFIWPVTEAYLSFFQKSRKKSSNIYVWLGSKYKEVDVQKLTKIGVDHRHSSRNFPEKFLAFVFEVTY